MKQAQIKPLDETAPPLRLPGWITQLRAQKPEDAAFLAGAALAHLHLVATHAGVPTALWRARLALLAAEACAGFSGRREGAAGLRDALHLTREGNHPGPAGEILLQWSRAVERPICVANLSRALPGITAAQLGNSLDASGNTPVDRASAALQTVLTAAPRAETTALILADAVLAQTLGWDHVVPLLALGLQPRDLALRDTALRLACHRAQIAAAGRATTLAIDLTRRAARLQAVAPQLRAKGAERAVDLFLARDALAPAALDFMSDRAARRLCDRLVGLGAVQELTGRDTFRLYGV